MDSALVERVRELYASEDVASQVPAIVELCHPEVEVVTAAGWMDMAPSFHGREGLRAYFAGLGEVFRRMHYELVALEERGDALVADILVQAEGRESGAASVTPVTQVLWFEDGLLRRIVGFTDREAALAAVESAS